ncbi:hypothetical protein [Longimicrobium sp.]|uniref:hypothetical protein n=1 Tax=Longimicrobium sp. TaxID=2029185 RepID=UPI002E3521BB|nr:hypothetical protein [Longimicrobium sp.]HEX6042262.1 hypothetical protein [Longimicrobium sp.]
MSAYQVTIQMSQQTVQQLLQSGFSLYGLHAAGMSGGRALPTVWFSSSRFSSSTVVSWTEDYQVYTSQSQVMPGAQITTNASFPIAPGMQLDITDPSGFGQVQQGGPPNAIGINNSTFAQLTVGLALGSSAGGSAPIHALPLSGNMMAVITPVPKVFLVFSPTSMSPGMAVAQASGSGVLVDLTGSPSQTVTFDINSGWQGGPGVQVFPSNQSLAPILLQP